MAEFRMLEAECAFMDSLDELCSLIEKYIKFIVRNMEPLKEDIENLNAFYDDSSNREVYISFGFHFSIFYKGIYLLKLNIKFYEL